MDFNLYISQYVAIQVIISVLLSLSLYQDYTTTTVLFIYIDIHRFIHAYVGTNSPCMVSIRIYILCSPALFIIDTAYVLQCVHDLRRLEHIPVLTLYTVVMWYS